VLLEQHASELGQRLRAGIVECPQDAFAILKREIRELAGGVLGERVLTACRRVPDDPRVNSLMPRAVATVAAALLVALAFSSAPSPTPPGRNGLIAFVTHTYSSEVGDGIAVIRPDGSGLRKVTKNARDRAPAWSPDGEWLAFDRAGVIYTIRADGTGLRRLTSRRSTVHEPAWSPDGRQLAFVTERSLVVVRSDGSGARRLYRIGAGSAHAPSWSPDGRWIAFGIVEDEFCVSGSTMVIGRDGRGLRNVTVGSGCESLIVTPGEDGDEVDANDSDPDWSPDGTRIAFTRLVWLCERCDQDAIFSSNVDGSDVHWVTTDTSFAAANPSWSPNGKRLVAEANDGIAILSFSGRRLRTLDPHGTEPAWQPR
jgi:Tol biopolymer transport system component